MNYETLPRHVVEDLVRLRRRIKKSGLPKKVIDHNLLIGTWNIRNFGRVYGKWSENSGSPKRNLRSLAYLSEIIKCYDVLAVQELKRNISAIQILLKNFLGSDWGLIVSDTTAGEKGNSERLGFIYDKRRVQPSGLAGEIVLPSTNAGNSPQQFDRTPYIVGFQSGMERFSLLTAHIRYGDTPEDRLGELTSLAEYTAKEIRDRTKVNSAEQNLIILGDFNIDDRRDNPLFEAFTSTGLVVPSSLLNLKTTYSKKPKYYDQIAWFMEDLDFLFSGKAGVVNFSGSIYQEMTIKQMSYRVSDHFPLWIEFILNRSTEQMAKVLGVNPAMPDPFGDVPD